MTDSNPSGPHTFPPAPGTIDHSDSARFEGEVDLAAERPATTMHGLRPDGTTKWLVGGLVGGSLLLAGIISLVRGDDDDKEARAPSSEIAAMQRFAAPLDQVMISLELARMEAITAEAVRSMGDAPARRELAHRATPSASPASTSTTASPRNEPTPARTSHPTAVPASSIRDLPVPEAVRADDEEATPPAAEPAEAPPPREPAAEQPSAPAEPPPAADPSAPLPSIGDDDSAEPDDRSSAPS